jgi:hypothetical protein
MSNFSEAIMKNAVYAAITGVLICGVPIMLSEGIMPFDFWVLLGGIAILIVAVIWMIAAKRRDNRRITDDPRDHRDIWPYGG